MVYNSDSGEYTKCGKKFLLSVLHFVFSLFYRHIQLSHASIFVVAARETITREISHTLDHSVLENEHFSRTLWLFCCFNGKLLTSDDLITEPL